MLQGRQCHAKFLEAAEKAARQFRRYEGAAEAPAIISEGLEHPTLGWLAKGNKHDWADAVAEVEAYNSDFQVGPSHAHAAVTPSCLRQAMQSSPSQSVNRRQIVMLFAQAFAEADSGSPPDSGRASSRSNADSARLSNRYKPVHMVPA